MAWDAMSVPLGLVRASGTTPFSGLDPCGAKSVWNALSVPLLPDPQAARPSPAVPIKKSVFPDYIICLEDGKPLEMLKRYLQVRFNLTPEEYWQRWGLPASYPMIAPTYSASRARLAKERGLGRKRTAKETPAAPDKRPRSGRRVR